MPKRNGAGIVPTQPRGVVTFNRILDAAASVLKEDGRDALRMQQISEKADVAIGTVYRYFPNREALLDYLWPTRRDIYLYPTHLLPYHRLTRTDDM